MACRLFRVSALIPSLLAAAALGLAAGGCVDTVVDAGPQRGAQMQQQRPAPRPGVSPHGASVGIASLEGAPEPVVARFRDALSTAADKRDIAIVASDKAQYRIRGYLTAAPAPEGTRYSCVWDVFDRQGRRAQRISDEAIVPARGQDWDGLDEKTLSEVARRGADDLSAFLSNTPEAIAAAGGGESGVSVVAVERAGPKRPSGVAEAR